jgi:vacuolar protein sorting-associated protein IST1
VLHLKLKVSTDIAEEYNLARDSSKTAAEFRKNHEDLLVT